MLSRVYVVQQPMKREGSSERPAFDFKPAEQYGKVVILARNGKDILTPDVFRRHIEDMLEPFDHQHDYVIPVGDYTVLFYIGMILGERFPYVRILRWVPGAKSYQPITLNVGTLV